MADRGVGSSHSTPALIELLGEPQILLLTSEIDPSIFASPPPNAQPQSAPGGAFRRGPVDSIVPEEMADVEIPGEGLLSAYSLEGELLWQTDSYYCSTPIPPPLRIRRRACCSSPAATTPARC